MRLIDADELIDTIYSKDYFTQTIKDVLVDIIETQPTAYNPEKVVEELEERSKEYNSGVRLHGKPEEMLTHDAIDIVRKGGIDG